MHPLRERTVAPVAPAEDLPDASGALHRGGRSDTLRLSLAGGEARKQAGYPAVRLRTTLQLASFFPIFVAALFIAFLFIVRLTADASSDGFPVTGVMVLALISLLAGWSFYRAGQKLVRQVDTLEQMTERVKRGDLKTTNPLPGAKGEVAAVADVLSQMVAELRGYVDLIAAHEELRRECDLALAAAERLRVSAVQVSGTLELLSRAERGAVARMLNSDLFLMSWLPPRALRGVLGVSGDALPQAAGAAGLRPDAQKVLRGLLAETAPSTSAAGEAPRVATGKPISVLEAVKDAVLLCQWTWERDRPHAPIAVAIDSGNAQAVDIQAERLSLVQAFVAVLTNAAEAMPEGGRVSIDLRSDSGGAVSLSIADSGLGMSDAVRSRCMKPFFSTKEGRLGMGLPLAVCVVTGCGGRLGVIGQPGQGATVHMTFPPPRTEPENEPLRQGPRAALNILLVDDDDTAREALVALLKKEGHRVTDVADGAAAVLLLRQRRFDVVMTDLAMPIMTGEELALAVKARHPATPVVLVTGAGDEMERRHLRPEGIDVVLPKPVQRYDLVRALARATGCTGPDPRA